MLKLLMLMALSLVSACSEDSSLQGRFEDYQARLANTLDIDIPLSEKIQTISYPDKRQRLQEIPPYTEGMIEVWDFKRCGLLQLINKRNSNLGKVMTPSQRFIYENAFWQKLKPCYQDREKWLAEDPQFVQRLTNLYQHKQAIMPQVFQQMLFSGPELERQFSATQQTLTPGQQLEFKTLTQALDQLITISEDPLNISITGQELEQHLHKLYQQPLLLSLLKSIQVSTIKLNQTAQLLENKRAKRPICLKGTATPNAKILFNLLQKYYLQGIQTELARHNRMANALLPKIHQLFLLADTDSELGRFNALWLDPEAPKGLWKNYQIANQRHTHIWNRILRECSLFPKT